MCLVLHGRYGNSCGRIAAPPVGQAELTEVITGVQVEQQYDCTDCYFDCFMLRIL